MIKHTGIRRARIGCITALLFSCPAVRAQIPGAALEPPHVYVVDFTQQGSDPNLSDLSAFTAGLIRLQLLRMPMIEVSRVVMRPPCMDEREYQTRSRSSSGQITPNAAERITQNSPSAPRISVTPSGNFYVIRGSIDIRPPDIAVDAVLEKCERGKLLTVTSDHALFVAGKALEQFTVLSQFLAYSLEGSLPKIRVKVADFKNVGHKGDSTAVDLTEQIKLELTRHPGFEVSDTPGYLVEGEVAKIKDILKATVRVHWADNVKTLEPTGAADDAPSFVRDVGMLVYDTLSAVLLAQRFGWKDYLDNVDVASLVTKGKRLLCIDQVPPCRVYAQSALSTLWRAKNLSSEGDWRTRYYLGMAQAAALKYSDAIATFKNVIALIETDPAKTPEATKTAINSLNELGDLYARYGDSKTAVTYYIKSLSFDPRQSEPYVRQADILFEGEAPAAVGVLLDGLEQASDKTTIHLAFQNNLRRVEPQDFGPVADILQSAVSRGKPVSEEYAILCATAASKLVENDPMRAEEFVRRARALPAGDVTSTTKSLLARSQTDYYFRKREFADAYNSALDARNELNDPSTQILVAQVELGWATDLQQSGHSGQKIADLLQDAYSILKPLVQASNSEAYQAFREVAHSVLKDRDSLALFADIAEKNPRDLEALRHQMYVCNEYLFDFSCAYSAAKKLFAGPLENVGLQLDAAEIAVLNRDYKQAAAWLEPVYAVSDADEAYKVYKTVADFYRFWSSYALDDADTKQEFQQLVQSLNESAQIRTASPPAQFWSFEGAKHALAQSDLSMEKQRLLRDIIAAFEDPSKGTAHLSLTPGGT